MLARIRQDKALQIDVHAGVVGSRAPGSGSDTTLAGLRVRWRPGHGPSGELRLVRRPLLASPALLEQPVDLSERRLTRGAPLAEALHGRMRLLHADLHEQSQTNRRAAYELSAVLQTAASTQLALSYGELRHRRPARSPYSAPQQVETVELAIYTEFESDAGIGLTVDVGTGRQRVTRFGEAPRTWTGMLRVHATISAPMGRNARVELGYERSDSPLGGRGEVPATNWQSNSLNLALQVKLAP